MTETKKTNEEIVKEMEQSFIEGSTLSKVSKNLALEMLYHWTHSLDMDDAALEKLVLLSRGALQVPGVYMAEVSFTTEMVSAVKLRLSEMWYYLSKNWVVIDEPLSKVDTEKSLFKATDK